MQEMNPKFLYVWRIVVVLLLNMVMIALLLRAGEEGSVLASLAAGTNGQEAVQTLSKVGSRGDEVRQIQKKLKELGYDPGQVDGIYGENTKKAVIAFQKAKGLNPDGIAGPQTLKALGISQDQGQFSSGDIDLLARIISAESRGEPYIGQVAVGAVILNRMEHPSFPNTLAGVIYQPGAFSCLDDGGVNAPVADSAYDAARDAINAWAPAGGAIYYYNPAKTTNQWIYSRPVIAQIGDHVFAK